MTRIALFGGSFNPIHIGHVWMAQTMQETMNADTILFMPTGDSPHKGEMLSAEHRAKMVELVCDENPGFVCSRFEVDREEISYTVRTVEHIMETYPGAKIDMLIGQDSFLQFDTWREYEKLLAMVKLVVVPRVTSLSVSLSEQHRKLEELGAKIHFMPMPVIQLSSTDIRDRVRNGRTVKNRVPEPVRKYIESHGLYEDPDWRAMRNKVKAKLSRRRYEHSLRVAEYATQLARIHGVDENQARIAGILHDSAKGIEAEILEDPMIEKAFHNREEDKALWHTELAPLIASSEYEITDPAILRAIRAHTTAIDPMSPLDQIIYLADKLEPGRHDPDNVQYRKMAGEDLQRAFHAVLKASMDYLETRGMKIHENTITVWENMNKGE